MSAELVFEVEWEALASGPPEERATFSAIGLRYGNVWLSEAEDQFIQRNRTKVHLSGYKLAEWLVLNWWRLRWEPRRQSPDWQMAHRLTAIGGGYVWPNITIASDGAFVEITARSTQPRAAEPLRYLTDRAAQVSAKQFEDAVDSFVNLVCGKLRADAIGGTNLELAWGEVCLERADPVAARWRRLEAMLGCDPDEAPAELLERLEADSRILGARAVEELAAEGGEPLSADEIRELANRDGHQMCLPDAVRLDNADQGDLPRDGLPWEIGAASAALIRRQLGVTTPVIDNVRLAELAGVTTAILNEAPKARLAFAWRQDDVKASLVLRSPYPANRRFDLARLLGDQLTEATAEALVPATRSYTARQKMQRAFAAELLCPIDELRAYLADDLTSENLDDSASYFQVSEHVVRSQLVNHHILPRAFLPTAA